MAEVRLSVVAAGLSWVQDLGRYQGSQFGLPVGGSSDQYSACCANILVGNTRNAPLIEITSSGMSMVPDADILIAVTGAVADLEVDGLTRPQWTPTVVAAGHRIEVSAPRRGARTYLAVSGRIQAPVFYGSVCPDRSLGIGWMLQPGDVITVESSFAMFDHPATGHPVFRPPVTPIRPGPPWPIRVVPGPHWDSCGDPRRWLLGSPYEVEYPSDTVGLRLRGAGGGQRTGERISRGVPIGAVEMPSGGGRLLVLLRGRMLTAGYPIPVVTASVDHGRLGQLSPGDLVRFQLVRRTDAVRHRHAQATELDRLTTTVAAMFEAAGLRPSSGRR